MAWKNVFIMVRLKIASPPFYVLNTFKELFLTHMKCIKNAFLRAPVYKARSRHPFILGAKGQRSRSQGQ